MRLPKPIKNLVAVIAAGGTMFLAACSGSKPDDEPTLDDKKRNFQEADATHYDLNILNPTKAVSGDKVTFVAEVLSPNDGHVDKSDDPAAKLRTIIHVEASGAPIDSAGIQYYIEDPTGIKSRGRRLGGAVSIPSANTDDGPNFDLKITPEGDGAQVPPGAAKSADWNIDVGEKIVTIPLVIQEASLNSDGTVNPASVTADFAGATVKKDLFGLGR